MQVSVVAKDSAPSLTSRKMVKLQRSLGKFAFYPLQIRRWAMPKSKKPAQRGLVANTHDQCTLNWLCAL